MGKRTPPTKHEGTADSTTGDACAEVCGLKDELQDWYDNLPESFQSGSKGDALSDAISTLENVESTLEGIDWPEGEGEIAVTYETTPKRRQSRSDRRDDVVAALYAVEAAVSERVETLREQADAFDRENSTAEADTARETADELESAVSYVQDAASELEGVEFPGMYS